MVLTLILAESAVELVPRELRGHPSVVASARKRERKPERLILDQSYHHAAIHQMGKSGVGRGRPDIAHFSLLLALGSPLNMQGMLRCYVHTIQNRVIIVNPKARLPRSIDRFVSLLEQLFEKGVVPPTGEPLLTLEPGNLTGLVGKLGGDRVVALSTKGQPTRMENVARRMSEVGQPVVMIGGFPEGHFSKETLGLADEVFSIYPSSLDAWTVVARAVYDYERAFGLGTVR